MILLLIGSVQMYNGIEISHPIYSTLFCNMVITLLSSMIDVFVFPLVKNLKYSTLVNGNSVICLLFHFCSWLVLSVLRYLYIIHPDWLHTKFTDARVVSGLATLGVIFIFTCSCSTMLGTLMYFGWPQVKMYHMPSQHKLVCVTTILANYTLLLSLSCFLYILILRKRGKLGVNSVTSLTVLPKPVDQPVNSGQMDTNVQDYGGIWIGQSVTSADHCEDNAFVNAFHEQVSLQ